jgi:hypothetical protein
MAQKWLGWLGSNQRMTIPKTVALPLGYTPLNNNLGWVKGLEPSDAGATIRCVNRFATPTTFASRLQKQYYQTNL